MGRLIQTLWPPLYLGPILLLVAFATHSVRAADDSFVIQDIQLQGLERITPGTLFNSLPIQTGDRYDSSRGAEIIRTLFQTGFFDDVQVERQ